MERVRGEDGSKHMLDRISELPQGILQRILYSLTQEEAVRTSVLSKSWRYIWCTRPNLDFSDATFNGNEQKFISVVDNTLQRYRDQRLCVEEFHLSISLDGSSRELVSILKRWIQVLSCMGVKKFRLCNRWERFTRDRIDAYRGVTHHLPDVVVFGAESLPDVVFGAESLQDLHVERFVLDQKAIQRIVLLKHLKTLRLGRISIEEQIFQKVISYCPMIETLEVDVCKRLRIIKVNDLHNLKKFTFSMYGHVAADEHCSIKIHPPSIQTIDINKANIWFHKGAHFRNLKELYLWNVKSSLGYLSSCKFPSLEYLLFFSCDGLKEMKLFVDAPNIREFDYEGDFVPSISFATTFSEWHSEVDITYIPTNDGSSWFLKLKELLNSLSQSKISLIIQQSDEDIIPENIQVQDIDGGDKPASIVVEDLRLPCQLSSFASLSNCAFSICRPRNIEVDFYGKKGDREIIECLWKTLMQRESGDKDDQFRQLWWLQDLEEVIFEIHDVSRKEWRPITLPELPYYHENIHSIILSEWPNHQQRTCDLIRFALKWRQSLSVFES